MSDYRTHTSFNLLFALPLVLIGCSDLLHLSWKTTLIVTGCFAYGTLFMSPDLDLAYQLRANTLRGILALPFRGYARLFSHRGLSHSLFFGTLTRVAWLGMFVLAFLILLYGINSSSESLLQFLQRPTLLAALGGLFLADLCHLLLDRLSSPGRA